MKIIILFVILLILVSFTACVRDQEGSGYRKISAEEIKKIIDENSDVVIIDVRTLDEFNTGHIEGSILIPYDEIAEQIENVVKDKNTLIVLYCRSGNRSKMAADALIALRYKNVCDMGGLNDWPYEITG
jgi:phage shock protein E